MKPLTGPMTQLNWTHKKGLNISEQPLSILASMLTASLNQIGSVSESSSHLRILPTNWHHKQPLSGPKANFIDSLIAALWACLIPGACLTPATERRYLSRQGTDKKIQIFRYRQSGAVALALWISTGKVTGC